MNSEIFFRVLKRGMSGLPYLRKDSLTFLDMHIKSKHFSIRFMCKGNFGWTSFSRQNCTVVEFSKWFKNSKWLQRMLKTTIKKILTLYISFYAMKSGISSKFWFTIGPLWYYLHTWNLMWHKASAILSKLCEFLGKICVPFTPELWYRSSGQEVLQWRGKGYWISISQCHVEC